MTGCDQFNQTIQKALNNEFLQTALNRATQSFKNLRRSAVAELEDFGSLRDRCKVSKDRVLNDLENHLLKFEAAVQGQGGQVFWAEDGQQAIEYVLNIAKTKKVRTVVKGKSMTTEEIHLNPDLEKAGIEVMETDLGEYIIQLLNDRPSHIIGPAIHKTKEEIARLLEMKIGMPYTEDLEVMTNAVRRELRSRFLSADMGISGANFAVAETGTVVLFENEGNIRMSTTLPKIHVVIMGMEKLVANTADLLPLLRALPISASGQRLPSYVSFLTGPGRSQGEGPEEMHVIILDGFRTKILADKDFRQLLRCLRCGACMNFCPVYRRIGGHSYPWVYPGPIGTTLTGASLGAEAARDVAGACTLCHACRDVCPVKIELPELILKIRRMMALKDPLAGGVVSSFAHTIANPMGFDLVGRLFEQGSKFFIDSDGHVRFGPSTLKRMGQDRRFPRLARRPFHRYHNKGD